MKNPLSQRMYYLLVLAESTNECEVQACRSAISVIEHDYPWLRAVAFTEQPQENRSLN